MVVGTAEVASNVFLLVMPVYHSEVHFESIQQCPFGLAGILFVAHFACDAVYKICAFASYIFWYSYVWPIIQLAIKLLWLIFGQYLHDLVLLSFRDMLHSLSCSDCLLSLILADTIISLRSLGWR